MWVSLASISHIKCLWQLFLPFCFCCLNSITSLPFALRSGVWCGRIGEVRSPRRVVPTTPAEGTLANSMERDWSGWSLISWYGGKRLWLATVVFLIYSNLNILGLVSELFRIYISWKLYSWETYAMGFHSRKQHVTSVNSQSVDQKAARYSRIR